MVLVHWKSFSCEPIHSKLIKISSGKSSSATEWLCSIEILIMRVLQWTTTSLAAWSSLHSHSEEGARDVNVYWRTPIQGCKMGSKSNGVICESWENCVIAICDFCENCEFWFSQTFFRINQPKFGQNDHREDAPQFSFGSMLILSGSLLPKYEI